MQSQPKPLTLNERLKKALEEKDSKRVKAILLGEEKGIDENDVLNVNLKVDETPPFLASALSQKCDLETVNLFIARGAEVNKLDARMHMGRLSILNAVVLDLLNPDAKVVEENKNIILALTAAGADPFFMKLGSCAHSCISHADFKLANKESFLTELKTNDIKFKFGGKHFSTKNLSAMVQAYGKDFVKQQLIEKLKDNKELESCEFDEKDIEGIVDAKDIMPLLARPQLKSLKLTVNSESVLNFWVEKIKDHAALREFSFHPADFKDEKFTSLIEHVPPNITKLALGKQAPFALIERSVHLRSLEISNREWINRIKPVLEKNDVLTEIEYPDDKHSYLEKMLELNREGSLASHARDEWAMIGLFIAAKRTKHIHADSVIPLFRTDKKNAKDETKLDFTSIRTLMGLSRPAVSILQDMIPPELRDQFKMTLTRDAKKERCIEVECRSRFLLRAMQRWMNDIHHSQYQKYFSFVPNTDDTRAVIHYPKELFAMLRDSAADKREFKHFLSLAISKRIEDQIFNSTKAKEMCFDDNRWNFFRDWNYSLDDSEKKYDAIIKLESTISTTFRQELAWYNSTFVTITPSEILSATKFYKQRRKLSVTSPSLISELENIANDKKLDPDDKVAMLMRLGDWLLKHPDIETEFKKENDAYAKIRMLYELKLKPITQILKSFQQNKEAFEIVKTFLLSREGMFLVYRYLEHVPRLIEFLTYLAKYNFLTKAICELAFRNMHKVGVSEFIEIIDIPNIDFRDYSIRFLRKDIVTAILNNPNNINRAIYWYETALLSSIADFCDIARNDPRKSIVPVVSPLLNQRMHPDSYEFFTSLVKRELITENEAKDFPPQRFDKVIPFIKIIPENLLTKESVKNIFANAIFISTIQKAYKLYQPRNAAELEKVVGDLRFAQNIVRENKPRAKSAAVVTQNNAGLFPAAADSKVDSKKEKESSQTANVAAANPNLPQSPKK